VTKARGDAPVDQDVESDSLEPLTLRASNKTATARLSGDRPATLWHEAAHFLENRGTSSERRDQRPATDRLNAWRLHG
jgi:hypothetical protein